MKIEIYKLAEKRMEIIGANTKRDMSTSEMIMLMDLAQSSREGLFNAISTAFNFGVYEGYHQCKNEKN